LKTALKPLGYNPPRRPFEKSADCRLTMVWWLMNQNWHEEALHERKNPTKAAHFSSALVDEKLPVGGLRNLISIFNKVMPG
jgi:hypothetical protein